MININETDREFQVSFAYSPWIVKAVKQIPGASYRGQHKHWVIPLTSERELLTWASPYQHFITKNKIEPVQTGPVDPLPDLLVEPMIRNDVFDMFHYQKQGLAYLLDHSHTICGDEPGLGKTVQAIATVETAGCKCILVICPATLRQNWKHEIENIWTHRKAMILSDRVKKTWPTFYNVGMVKYFICNFENLKKFFVDSIDVPHGESFLLKHITFNKNIDLFDAVIVDEIHRCKDGSTQQAKITMGLTREKKHVIALTGTAVVNTARDLVAQLHIIGMLKPVFGSYKNFMERYCSRKRKPGMLKELNYLMHKNCFYRRLKRDVLTELPDKMRNVVRCEITNMPEYQKAENDLTTYMRENMGKSASEIRKSMNGEVMVMIQILKKISARGKLDYIIEHIRGVMEAGEKLVMFAWHKEIVAAIKTAFPGALTITGDDNMDARVMAVKLFQEDPKFQLIICNIKSGGVGITLTASSRVGFAELPWHPADCDQCEDRCHRIGQKDSVEATYFLGHNTIDEDIYKIINEKRKIVKDIIGTEDIETNVLDEFINLFKQKL